jgi:hypothetical protein
MYKKVLAILAPLFLFGCDAAPSSNIGADGYRFGEPSFEKDRVTITLVTYPSQADFDREVRRRKIDTNPNKKVEAFAVLYAPNFDICEIHIVKPTTRYMPEFMGHETYHCFYGEWHN